MPILVLFITSSKVFRLSLGNLTILINLLITFPMNLPSYQYSKEYCYYGVENPCYSNNFRFSILLIPMIIKKAKIIPKF